MSNEDEPYGIRLPSSLLEKILEKEEKGDYKEDNSRFTKFDVSSKKRKQKPAVSRKEKRQQEKVLKKQKKAQNHVQKQKQQLQHQQQQRAKKEVSSTKKAAVDVNTKNKTKKAPSAHKLVKRYDTHKHNEDEESEDETGLDNDPLERLRQIKLNKSKTKGSSALEIRIVKEDDLKDDSFDEDDSFGEGFDDEEVEESENEEDFQEEEEDEDDPMEQLRRLKGKKQSKVEDVRVIKEDDLNDDSFDSSDFQEEQEEEEEEEEDNDPMEQLRRLKLGKKQSKSENIRVIKEDDLNDDSFDSSDFQEEEEEEEIDPMEQLRRIKGKKQSKSENIRVVKEDDLEDDSLNEDDFGSSDTDEAEVGSDSDSNDIKVNASKETLRKNVESSKQKKDKKSKEKHDKLVSSRDLDLIKRDEDDMAYYAKKLGLKNGKKSKLSKQGDDDMIGGLLDGLDFLNDSYEEEKEDLSEEEVSQEEDDEEEELVNKGENDSDYGSFDEGDFDEDELRELREMEELENSSNEEPEDDGDTLMVEAKENPFMAPQSATSGGGYVPPALRKKMALESEEITEEILNIQRSIKRQLNKLSEANITSIVNEINQLYLNNPRQLVTENLTNIVLNSIQQQGRLLDTFVYLHACLVVAIHRLQGVEFGAYFIQTLVEKIDANLKDLSGSNKEVSNLISLLSSVYTFQLVSSRLLYDLIKELINELDESNAELLLRLIQNSGNQMRSDDPQSLKEIILLVNKKSISATFSTNPRAQFLIETITSLKNNKLKVHNEGSQQLIIRMKKVLGTSLNSKNNDPLQVSLDDIRNVEERGKWWLVGSAWKGYNNEANESSENGHAMDFDAVVLNDILDNAEPNWVELARSQRMNTDIRRAIFISIMSANDYVDAMTKLDKLALKRSQEREIPRIILHCTGIEPSWNPYYGVLASKLCDSHSYRKSFQFMLWDLLRDFESSDRNGGSDEDEEEQKEFFDFDANDMDDDSKLKKILNLGRFFGYLLAEGCLPLNVLRTINFLTANGDTVLFLEILFITFLDSIAKKSQTSLIGTGTKKLRKENVSSLNFDTKILIERVGKAYQQPVLLKGIEYFLNGNVKNSAFITGRRQRARIEWGVSTMSEIIDDLLRGTSS